MKLFIIIRNYNYTIYIIEFLRLAPQAYLLILNFNIYLHLKMMCKVIYIYEKHYKAKLCTLNKPLFLFL